MLGRSTRHGDPISTYLFILALEILLHITRPKPEIKGLSIFDHCYLYSAYVDGATFFLQDTVFIKHMVETFYPFSSFSGLKLVVGIGAGIVALKGVQVAVFCLRFINLNNDTLKILGTYFSYNEKLKEEKNFYKTVTDIQ